MANQTSSDFEAKVFLERELDRHLKQIGVNLAVQLRKPVIESFDFERAQRHIDRDVNLGGGGARKRALKHKRRITYLLRRFVHAAQHQLAGRDTMTAEDLRIVYDMMLSTRSDPGHVIFAYHDVYPCDPRPPKAPPSPPLPSQPPQPVQAPST